MVKPQDVDTSNVTPEMIGKCHKCFSGSTPFYMVESEQDSLTEYKVTWTREHGFTCTCKAGQYGFANCKDVCKHCKWAIAASAEEKEAVGELHRLIAEQAAPVLNINGKPASAAELERVMNAASKPVSRRAKAYEPRPFSLI